MFINKVLFCSIDKRAYEPAAINIIIEIQG